MLSHSRQPLRAALLLALVVVVSMPMSFFTPRSIALAQEEEGQVVVAGSRYLEELFNNLVSGYEETAGNSLELSLEAEGNIDGFTRLCDGSVTMALATREITDEEMLVCDNNSVQFVELLLALDGLVLVANAESGVTCLAVEALPRIFLQDTPPTWSVLAPDAPDTPISIYGPATDGRAYSILNALLEEQDPTVDYTVYESPADVIEPLQDAANSGLAFMTLAEWAALENTGNAQLLEFNSDENPDCTPATTGTIAGREYPASRLLMLYVNAEAFNQVTLASFLQFGFGLAETPVEDRPLTGLVSAQGFSVPPQAIYDRALNNVRGPLVGRTFTRGDSPVTINTAVEGAVTIGGAGLADYAAKAIYQTFNAEFTAITVNRDTFGNDAGWAAFCAGETSIIEVSRPATEEEIAACESNGITPLELYLGAQAVVLVVKADSGLPTCVSYAELNSMVVRPPVEVPAEDEATEETETTAEGEGTATAAPEAEETATTSEAEATPADGEESTGEGEETTPEPVVSQGPTRWNEVNPDWPDLPLLVLTPAMGALETDIILGHVSPGGFVRRSDYPTIQETPEDSSLSDLAYRLGGLANADNAITYVLWSDWQSYDLQEQGRLVEVDGRNGCVAPSDAAFNDGSYPFAFRSWVVFSEEALSDPIVAALLWHAHSREALDSIDSMNLVGFDRTAFENRRDTLFTLIEAAQAAAAPEDELGETPDGEATAEPTAEGEDSATPSDEATEAPDGDATVEPTSEPTAEATTEGEDGATPSDEATATSENETPATPGLIG